MELPDESIRSRPLDGGEERAFISNDDVPVPLAWTGEFTIVAAYGELTAVGVHEGDSPTC